MEEETTASPQTNDNNNNNNIAMEYEIVTTASSSGPHLSGLLSDGLILGPTTTTSPPSSDRGSCSSPGSPGDPINPPKQPFVIGNICILLLYYENYIMQIILFCHLRLVLGPTKQPRRTQTQIYVLPCFVFFFFFGLSFSGFDFIIFYWIGKL